MKNILAKTAVAVLTATVLLFTRTAHAQSAMPIEDATTSALTALGSPADAWFGQGQNRVEKGVNVWKFTVVVNKTSVFEVRVDAVTGAKIKVDRKGSTTLVAPAVTMNRAAQIGRGAKPGVVWKVEGNIGLTIWSVYISGTDGNQYEVKVSSATGDIIKSEVRGGHGTSNDG